MLLERKILQPEIKEKMINKAMKKLECIFGTYCESYWLDPRHNILALLDNDERIEIHYDLYGDEGIVCTLMVLETDNATREGLLEKVIEVVNAYYGV